MTGKLVLYIFEMQLPLIIGKYIDFNFSGIYNDYINYNISFYTCCNFVNLRR